MKVKSIVFLLIILFVLNVSGMSTGIRLACVGDSITTGWYPELLKNKIEEKKINIDLRVFASKGLMINSVILKKLRTVYESKWNPTHVVFFAGINDCILEKEGQHVRADFVIEKIKKAVSVIRKNDSKPIIVSFYPLGKGNGLCSCSTFVNQWLFEYFSNNETVIDISEMGNECNISKKYDAGDGIHLNYQGHKFLSQKIFEQINWNVD